MSNKQIVIVDDVGDELFTGESALAKDEDAYESEPPTLRSRKDSGVFPRSKGVRGVFGDAEDRSA